jgi:hypothetical protein
LSRITPTARKCIDLFWAYTRREITKQEMNRKLDDIESKQLKLPMGRRRK